MSMIDEIKWPPGYTTGDYWREALINGNPETREVFVNHPIHSFQIYPGPSQALINYSPGGFSWGHMDSGSAQLALAILQEISTNELACKFHQEFKEKVIAKQPTDKALCIPLQDVVDFILEKTERG